MLRRARELIDRLRDAGLGCHPADPLEALEMPVLPLIDALIFFGWSSLFGGMLIKAIYLTTHFRPAPFGLTPSDFVTLAVVCLLFAMTLAARTWVKAHEPELLARRRRARLAEAGYGEDDFANGARTRTDEEPARRIAGY
jgi:hypothetical protein